MLRTCDLELFICFKGVVYIVITILCVYCISKYLSIFFIILHNVNTLICLHIYVCICVYVYVYVCMCIYVYMYICICIYMDVCVYMYVYVCVSVCMHVYVYMYDVYYNICVLCMYNV